MERKETNHINLSGKKNCIYEKYVESCISNPIWFFSKLLYINYSCICRVKIFKNKSCIPNPVAPCKNIKIEQPVS